MMSRSVDLRTIAAFGCLALAFVMLAPGSSTQFFAPAPVPLRMSPTVQMTPQGAVYTQEMSPVAASTSTVDMLAWGCLGFAGTAAVAMLAMKATAKPRAAAPVMSTNPDAPIKLGINGFGRIGRQVARIAMEREDFVLKHINSPMSPDYMKYLLEHDTVHGRFSKKGGGAIEITDRGLMVNGLPITLSSTRDPTEIPWKDTGVEYVCESTGAFTTTEGCMKHVDGGAKKVIISAPAKDAETPTIVVGVNTDDYKTSMNVVSCASCTTNGLAPLVKVINEKFGIKQGLMTTVHAATASQLTVDGSMKGKDWRAGRAASANIIPSSTGAAKAEVKRASQNEAKGIVGYTEDQVVSSDFVGEICSTVFDAEAGIMLTPTFVKLITWYDNEWGYSTRLVDLVAIMAVKDGVLK